MRPYAFRQAPWNPALRARYAGSGFLPIEAARALPPAALPQSQPMGPGPESGTPVRLPGANFPPAGSRGLVPVGDGDIAPGGTATLITVQIPDNARLRINAIGFGADDEVALGFLTWSIQASGIVIPGYEAVPAALGSLRNPYPVTINLGSSQLVTVTASSDATAVLTYHFIAEIQGYFYTEMGA